MCINAEVSLATFIAGMVIGALLWQRNIWYDRWNAAFVWSFIAVQFGEFLVWNDLNPGTTIHALGMHVILIAVMMQPIIQCLGAAMYTVNGTPFFMAAFLGVFLMSFTLPYVKDLYADVGPGCHLAWRFKYPNMSIYTMYYMIFMVVPLLAINPFVASMLMILYGAFTLAYSYSNYKTTGEFGSMWCLLALGYGMLCYFMPLCIC